MNVLVLNYSTYSKKHLSILKKNFKNIFFRNFINKIQLINFLKTLKKKKIAINILFTSLGIYYDETVIKFMDDKVKYLVSPTTSLNHINYNSIKHKTKIIYLGNIKKKKELKKITSTAELTILLILMLYRKIETATFSVKNNLWNRDDFIGNEIYGKKVGILGFGRIGRIVAKILYSFGANIYYYEKKKIKVNKYKKSTLNYIFKNCDIISVHLNSTTKTKKLITKKFLSIVKKKALLINTSRGEIINEKDLISSLKKKKLAGAALDVLDSSSTWRGKIKNNSILNFSKHNKNLIITPHIGGNTFEGSFKSKDLIIRYLIKRLNRNVKF